MTNFKLQKDKGFSKLNNFAKGRIRPKAYSAGFTMLEMIIVIFVFLTGIIGVYSIIQNFYTTAIYSSNRFIASYLSQEGIELIKNLRDNNLITGDTVDWRANIISGYGGSGNCLAGSICKIDYNNSAVSLDNGSSQAFLKKAINDFYNYDSGGSTIFKRKIIITKSPDSSPDYINVSVETEWYKKDLKTREGSIKVEDNLYGYW